MSGQEEKKLRMDQDQVLELIEAGTYAKKAALAAFSISLKLLS